MRTDIPCRQRMTRAIGSASLGRAPKSDRDLRRAPNPRPRPRRPRRSGRRFRAPADAPLRRERPRLGHGVGMGQYGAYGYAKHGLGYRAILAHYYPGTTIGTAPVRRVRILLAQKKAKLTISSTADFTVTDATGETHDVAAGTTTFDSKLKLKVDAAAKAKALPGPLLFAPGTAPLELGHPYRAQIQVTVAGTKLQAVDVVGLEPYPQGVVPAEMPHTWAPEALKAQAVAARSYALSHLQAGSFDLYPDTRSQVYRGVVAETPETNAAVQATAGQVVLFAGRVAKTFFFSTSGGRTMSAADAWGTPIP